MHAEAEQLMRTAAATWLFSLMMACGYTAQSASVQPVNTAAPDQRSQDGNRRMIVRISELDIELNQLEEYTQILAEEAEASMRLEPGVICIFPMYRQAEPTAVRILEIYASREAYDSHIGSSHFQKYKKTTLKMVKALKLIDMSAVDAQTMARIFAKM
jgi:quinol monooxygenase YgiN